MRILFLALLMAACGGSGPEKGSDNPGKIAPPKPTPLPKTELMKAQLKNVLEEIDSFIDERFNGPIIFANLNDGNVIGRCRYYENPFRPIQIELDKTSWDNMCPTARFALVLHELAHCTKKWGHHPDPNASHFMVAALHINTVCALSSEQKAGLKRQWITEWSGQNPETTPPRLNPQPGPQPTTPNNWVFRLRYDDTTYSKAVDTLVIPVAADRLTNDAWSGRTRNPEYHADLGGQDALYDCNANNGSHNDKEFRIVLSEFAVNQMCDSNVLALITAQAYSCAGKDTAFYSIDSFLPSRLTCINLDTYTDSQLGTWLRQAREQADTL